MYHRIDIKWSQQWAIHSLGTSWNKSIHVADPEALKRYTWKSLLDGTTQSFWAARGTRTAQDKGIDIKLDQSIKGFNRHAMACHALFASDTRPAHLCDDCFRTALPFSFTAADSSVDYSTWIGSLAHLKWSATMSLRHCTSRVSSLI